MRRLRKRSFVLAGHSTSVALEEEFWVVLEAIAAKRGLTISSLLAAIDEARGDRPLASALRVAALAAAAEGSKENVSPGP